MKQIIHGKKYDTDTAQKIESWSNIDGINILSPSDAYFRKSILYKKRTGEFFRWDYCTNEGVEEITPLTEQEAKRWCERLSADRYEEIWGEVAE